MQADTSGEGLDLPHFPIAALPGTGRRTQYHTEERQRCDALPLITGSVKPYFREVLAMTRRFVRSFVLLSLAPFHS